VKARVGSLLILLAGCGDDIASRKVPAGVAQDGLVSPSIRIAEPFSKVNESGAVTCSFRNVGTAAATAGTATVRAKAFQFGWVSQGGATVWGLVKSATKQAIFNATASAPFAITNPAVQQAAISAQTATFSAFAGYDLRTTHVECSVEYVNGPQRTLLTHVVLTEPRMVCADGQADWDPDCLVYRSDIGPSLKWTEPRDTVIHSSKPWAEWPGWRRSDLRAWVYFHRQVQALGCPQIPALVAPNLRESQIREGAALPSTTADTVLNKTWAWRLFASYASLSIAIEHEREWVGSTSPLYVPWSLVGPSPWRTGVASAESMTALFDGSRVFLADLEGTYLVYNFTTGIAAVPQCSRFVLQFMRDRGLVQSTRIDTIDAVLRWAGRLIHGSTHLDTSGAPLTEAREVYLQTGYWGGYPVQTMLHGTPEVAPPGVSVVVDTARSYRYTQGCHSTGSLINYLLRTVNVPALPELDPNAHARVRFPTEGLTLPHGDDPYWVYDFGLPVPIGGKQLLATSSQLAAWVSLIQPREPSLGAFAYNSFESHRKYVTGSNLMGYCEDVAACLPYVANPGGSPDSAYAGSALTRHFGGLYTLAELKQSGILAATAHVAAAQGGCNAVFQALYEQGQACATGSEARMNCNGPATSELPPHGCYPGL